MFSQMKFSNPGAHVVILSVLLVGFAIFLRVVPCLYLNSIDAEVLSFFYLLSGYLVITSIFLIVDRSLKGGVTGFFIGLSWVAVLLLVFGLGGFLSVWSLLSNYCGTF